MALNPNLPKTANSGIPSPGGPDWMDFVVLLKSGDRAALGRALTLVESNLETDRPKASALLDVLSSSAHTAFRIGISGIPGVGKSTWIETYGMRLLEQHPDARLAVLAVDPSSSVRGGSLLGDKTRMEKLSVHPRAFVRPSPAGTSLGGVTWGTRDAIALCERLGYTHVLVETVGVGQSETAVHDLVDCLVLLLMPASGDGLQGIKKGIMELADVIAVQKADGPLMEAAQQAASDARAALRFTALEENAWTVPVLTVSALTGGGMDALDDALDRFRRHALASGRWNDRRIMQRKKAYWEGLQRGLWDLFENQPGIRSEWDQHAQDVLEGTVDPRVAVEKALELARRKA
jgi:LAO/AO transport system kinase